MIRAVFAVRRGDRCIVLGYRESSTGAAIRSLHLDAADREDAIRAVDAINTALGLDPGAEPSAGDPAEKE